MATTVEICKARYFMKRLLDDTVRGVGGTPLSYSTNGTNFSTANMC